MFYHIITDNFKVKDT